MTPFSSMQRQINWLLEQVDCLNKDKVYQNNIVIPISVNYGSINQTIISEINKLNIIVNEDEILVIDAIDTDNVNELLKYMFRPGRGTYGVDGVEITSEFLYLLSSGGSGTALDEYLPLSGGTLTGRSYYSYDSTGDVWDANEIANYGYLNSFYQPLSETGTAGEAISIGNIIYQDNSTFTWLKATATDIAKCTGKLGIAGTTVGIGSTVQIRVRSQLNTTGLVKGTLIYVGETAGTYTTVLPILTGSYAVLIGKATDTDVIHFDFHTLTAVAIDGSEVNGVTMATGGGGGGDVYLANTQTFLGENTFTDTIIIKSTLDYTPVLEFRDVDGFSSLLGVINPTTKDLELQKESGIKIVSDDTYFTGFDGTTSLGSFKLAGAFADVNTIALQDAAGANSSMIATNEWVLDRFVNIDDSNYAKLDAANYFTVEGNTFYRGIEIRDTTNSFNALSLKVDNVGPGSTVGNTSGPLGFIQTSAGDTTSFLFTDDGTLVLQYKNTNLGWESPTTTISIQNFLLGSSSKILTTLEWVETYITANADGFLRNIHEDLTPTLGAVLRTNDQDIIITDGSDSVRGIIGRDATTDEPFFVRSVDGSYDVNDGGMLLAAGRIELHGANTEIFALSGTDNRQVYVNEQGGLFAVPAPIPGWEEVDLDIIDYALTGIGTTWVEMTGLIITLPEDVLVGTTLNIITNLHILNNSATSGGNILVGFGVNNVAPTTGVNIRVEGAFDSLVPIVLSTTQHGGLVSTDTISVFVRRETEDSAPFDPELHGSTAPDHELQVSVPTVGGGSSGVYSFTFPLEETGGTVTFDDANFAKTNIAETFDSTLTVTDFLTIGLDKDIKLTATTNTLNASLTAGKFLVNTTEAGAWTLPLVEMTHTDVSKSQIGVFGNSTALSYSFLGNAYNDAALKWFADGSVVINGTTDSAVEHAGFNFFVNGLAKFTSVTSGVDPVLDEHFITLGFADAKYSNEHALSVVKNADYITDAIENDYIIEMISPATKVTLDATGKEVGFRQQVLNNIGSNLVFETTDPVIGDNIPLAQGLFAYYVLLADGVTWGLAIASSGGGSGTYTFTSPLVESAGNVTFDETNFAKTDVLETFNDGVVIKKSVADSLNILQLQTSTGVRVLDIQNTGSTDATGIARFEDNDLQLNFNGNFEMRQKNVGKSLILTFKNESDTVVAGVNRTGTIFMQDPVNPLDGVNLQYLENNFTVDVIDNLTTQDPLTALSANQGYVLDQTKADLTTDNVFAGANDFNGIVNINSGQLNLGADTTYGKLTFYGGAGGAPRAFIEWNEANQDVRFSSPAGNGYNFGGTLSINTPVEDTHATTKLYVDSLSHGDVFLAASQTFAGANTFSQSIISSVITGTAPFTVASITEVANLNAALLGGFSTGQYLRSDVADVKTSGHLTFGDSINAVFGSSNNSGISATLAGGTTWQMFAGNLAFKNGLGATTFDFESTSGNFVATGSVKGTNGLISEKGASITGVNDTTVMIRGSVNGDYFASDGTLQFLRGAIPSDELGSIPNTTSPFVDVAFTRDEVTNGWDMVLPYLGLTAETYRHIYLVGGSYADGAANGTPTMSQINSGLQIGFKQFVPDLVRAQSRVLSVNGNVGATAFYNDSLRKLKKNILPFTKSGLDIINSLNIKTFDYKDGSVKNSIGVIIDDSPKEIANPEHDAVDLSKVIFVQAKAIQELTKRLEQLENR